MRLDSFSGGHNLLGYLPLQNLRLGLLSKMWIECTYIYLSSKDVPRMWKSLVHLKIHWHWRVFKANNSNLPSFINGKWSSSTRIATGLFKKCREIKIARFIHVWRRARYGWKEKIQNCKLQNSLYDWLSSSGDWVCREPEIKYKGHCLYFDELYRQNRNRVRKPGLRMIFRS